VAKTVVEDCRKMSIYSFKPYLYLWCRGTLSWSRGERKFASISYQVKGDDQPSAIRLFYTLTPWDGEKIDLDYTVPLTTSRLAWGKQRYWFVCPLQGCGRRVGCLYLPSGAKYFGCRHCYWLSYQSQFESSISRLFDMIDVAFLQENYPGVTLNDVRALRKDKTTPHMRQLEIERYLRELQNYDPYEGFLSVSDLCQQSGLTQENLSQLEAARLLLPDTRDRRYRPKLEGWANKLAYLLNEGWSIEEIRAWAKGRWKTENPREWPPERNHSISSLADL